VLLAALKFNVKEEVSSDAALVQRLLRRDVNAFEQLYDRHSRIVYSVVLRILRQVSTAEEVVQEVFLQVWRNSSQYDGSRGPFVPWLLTLARNRALDHLRLKSERQRRLEGQPNDHAGDMLQAAFEPHYEQALDEKRRAERVRGLIASLPPQQRRAIELAYFAGMSHSEIAAALKEPLGTVKSWIRNALLKLKEELQAKS
jgi:RNA polymerase sigma-70 factor, ECF subfamily